MSTQRRMADGGWRIAGGGAFVWLLILAAVVMFAPLGGFSGASHSSFAEDIPEEALPAQASSDAPMEVSEEEASEDVGPRHVALIRVTGVIYDFTLDSLERRVERAREAGANMIVIDMDTYGGVVTATLEISKFLKRLEMPSVVWINDKAYSAGILIGVAAGELVMAPTGSAGDAAPVVPGMELPPTERAKALTPILAELQDSADRNGYHFAPLHAMVEYGIEVHEIEHKETGERKLVNQVDYEVMVRGTRIEDAGKPGLVQRFLPGGGDGTAIMLGVVEASEEERG